MCCVESVVCVCVKELTETVVTVLCTNLFTFYFFSNSHFLLPIFSCERFKCFLDKHRLVGGENWKDQFLSALERSCLFLPLLSASALRPLRKDRDINENDNFLLEMETALKLREEKRVVIFPLLVGECVDGGAYHRFDEVNGEMALSLGGVSGDFLRIFSKIFVEEYLIFLR